MIFLSYSRQDRFEAQLLQFAFETLLADIKTEIWTYERDQAKSERAVAEALKKKVKESKAMCFIVSDSTISAGAAQWMELAYADAFDIPTFVILHRVTYDNLKSPEANVPPLLLSSHCNLAEKWKDVANEMRKEIQK